jgi:organic hydroperoxide reductase OsmC/OhrA
MAAVAACFVATFRSNAEFSQFEALGLEVTAEGSVERTDGGLRFMRVILRPVLSVAPGADREHGLRLLERAGRSCVISRSLRGQIIFEPKVLVSETVPTKQAEGHLATPHAAP